MTSLLYIVYHTVRGRTVFLRSEEIVAENSLNYLKFRKHQKNQIVAENSPKFRKLKNSEKGSLEAEKNQDLRKHKNSESRKS